MSSTHSERKTRLNELVVEYGINTIAEHSGLECQTIGVYCDQRVEYNSARSITPVRLEMLELKLQSVYNQG